MTLVILASGMGSRYGGLKQIDPVDEYGNKIIDFSIYDAIRAGFKKVVFVIKKENEQDFRTLIGDIVKDHIEVMIDTDDEFDWYMQDYDGKKWTEASSLSGMTN